LKRPEGDSPNRVDGSPGRGLFAEFTSKLSALGIEPEFRPIPDEVSDPIPFAEDTVHAAYEPEWANRFWRVLSQVDLVLKDHRSPAFGAGRPPCISSGEPSTLANTRFSGRTAEPPARSGRIERLSADAEEVCCGFWPGNAKFPQAAFFSYTYPKPEGIEQHMVEPSAAGWNPVLGEFCAPL